MPAGRLRIALVAPPFLPLPPPGYAGTERVVSALAIALHERGHRVTVFGPGDSDLPCEVVATVEHSLWKNGDPGMPPAGCSSARRRPWRRPIGSMSSTPTWTPTAC